MKGQEQEQRSLAEYLVGLELSQVIFVHDYLQLIFHEVGITIFGFPFVYFNATNYNIENREYRNILCETIGIKVEKISFDEEHFKYIYFEDSRVIVFDLELLRKQNNDYEVLIIDVDKEGIVSEIY